MARPWLRPRGVGPQSCHGRTTQHSNSAWASTTACVRACSCVFAPRRAGKTPLELAQLDPRNPVGQDAELLARLKP
jgi:hypothetical protein